MGAHDYPIQQNKNSKKIIERETERNKFSSQRGMLRRGRSNHQKNKY
jgi:hypothetical protein